MILGRGRGLNLQEILGPSTGKSGNGSAEKTVSPQNTTKLSPLAAAFQPKFHVSRSSSSSSLRSSASIDDIKNPYNSVNTRISENDTSVNKTHSRADNSESDATSIERADTTPKSPTQSPGVYHGCYIHKPNNIGQSDKILITVKKSSKNFADNLVYYLRSKSEQLGPAGCMAAPQFKTFFVCGSEKVTFAGSSKSGLLDRCLEVIRECYTVTTHPLPEKPHDPSVSLHDPISPMKLNQIENKFNRAAGDSSPELQITENKSQNEITESGDGIPENKISNLKMSFLRTGQVEMYRSNKSCRRDVDVKDETSTVDYNSSHSSPCDHTEYNTQYQHTNSYPCTHSTHHTSNKEDWDEEAESEPFEPFVFGKSAFKYFSVAVNLGHKDAWSHLASGKSLKQQIKEQRDFFFDKSKESTLSETDRRKLRGSTATGCTRDIRLVNGEIEGASSNRSFNEYNTTCKYNEHETAEELECEVFTADGSTMSTQHELSTSDEEIPVINIKFDEIKLNERKNSSSSSTSDNKNSQVPAAVESRAVDMSVQTNIQSIDTVLLPAVQTSHNEHFHSISQPAARQLVQSPAHHSISTHVHHSMMNTTRTYDRKEILHYSRSHLSKKYPDFILDKSIECIAGNDPYLPKVTEIFDVDNYEHKDEYKSTDSMFMKNTSEIFKPRLNRLNSTPSFGLRISNFTDQHKPPSAPPITSFADLYKSDSTEHSPNNQITRQVKNLPWNSDNSSAASHSAPIKSPCDEFKWERGLTVPTPERPDKDMSADIPQVAVGKQSIP